MKKIPLITILLSVSIVLGILFSVALLRKWRTQGGGKFETTRNEKNDDGGKSVRLACEGKGNRNIGDISEFEIKETPRMGVGQHAGERKVLEIKGIAYAFRWCPAGSFTMGSPEREIGRHRNEPQHEVTLTEGFWLLETPVTQEMWESVMGTTIAEQRDKASEGWPLYGVGKKHPMYYVSWEECQKFCWEISEETGETISLPTEAQWEYACRAGSETALYTGEIDFKEFFISPALDEIGWYRGNSSQDYEGEGMDSRNWIEVRNHGNFSGSHPVGEKKPNSWGLYDMHGNVWEWCEDLYGDYPSGGITDPKGSENGPGYIVRGGSWNCVAADCRSADRRVGNPENRIIDVGFRVLLSPTSR